MKKVYVFILLCVCLIFLLTACNKDNAETESLVKELEQTVKEKDAKIKLYEKEYELRNILDIETRKLLSALNPGIFSESEKNILNDNIAIKEDRLAISYQGHENEILFFQNKLDFEQVGPGLGGQNRPCREVYGQLSRFHAKRSGFI